MKNNSGFVALIPVHGRSKSVLIRELAGKPLIAYAAKPEYVMRANWIFDGKVMTINVPAERAVGADTELDFAFAEFLMTRSRIQDQDEPQDK